MFNNGPKSSFTGFSPAVHGRSSFSDPKLGFDEYLQRKAQGTDNSWFFDVGRSRSQITGVPSDHLQNPASVFLGERRNENDTWRRKNDWTNHWRSRFPSDRSSDWCNEKTVANSPVQSESWARSTCVPSWRIPHLSNSVTPITDTHELREEHFPRLSTSKYSMDSIRSLDIFDSSVARNHQLKRSSSLAFDNHEISGNVGTGRSVISSSKTESSIPLRKKRTVIRTKTQINCGNLDKRPKLYEGEEASITSNTSSPDVENSFDSLLEKDANQKVNKSVKEMADHELEEAARLQMAMVAALDNNNLACSQPSTSVTKEKSNDTANQVDPDEGGRCDRPLAGIDLEPEEGPSNNEPKKHAKKDADTGSVSLTKENKLPLVVKNAKFEDIHLFHLKKTVTVPDFDVHAMPGRPVDRSESWSVQYKKGVESLKRSVAARHCNDVYSVPQRSRNYVASSDCLRSLAPQRKHHLLGQECSILPFDRDADSSRRPVVQNFDYKKSPHSRFPVTTEMGKTTCDHDLSALPVATNFHSSASSAARRICRNSSKLCSNHYHDRFLENDNNSTELGYSRGNEEVYFIRPVVQHCSGQEIGTPAGRHAPLTVRKTFRSNSVSPHFPHPTATLGIADKYESGDAERENKRLAAIRYTNESRKIEASAIALQMELSDDDEWGEVVDLLKNPPPLNSVEKSRRSLLSADELHDCNLPTTSRPSANVASWSKFSPHYPGGR